MFEINKIERTDITEPKKRDPLSVNLRRMVVFLVNFRDQNLECSADEIDDLMWRNRFSCIFIFFKPELKKIFWDSEGHD